MISDKFKYMHYVIPAISSYIEIIMKHFEFFMKMHVEKRENMDTCVCTSVIKTSY